MLNVNVGVLGHVDCGKTSLVAALSTTLSTAALDKHPQSKERGITLDLGFSAFTVPAPEQLQQLGHHSLQFTLVDCPGHASLIRTIIGGAQIIDTMILVIDVTKGIQAQTAECLVVGEIAAKDLVVALNKIDTLPEELRAKAVKKATKLLHQTLAVTKFGKAPVIPVAAKPVPLGIEDLKAWLVKSVLQQQQQHGQVPASQQQQQAQHPFLFSIDHCFPIKGQGTVMTGTVLQGSCKVNDSIELPALKLSRPIKGIHMFHKPVTSLHRGDRAAICVTQLNPKLVERGLAAAPGSLPTFSAAVAVVDKVRFYGGGVPGKQKYHVIVGHETVMAEATFFGLPDGEGMSQAVSAASLQQLGPSLNTKKPHPCKMPGVTCSPLFAPVCCCVSIAASLQQMINFLNKTAQHTPLDPFNWDREYVHQTDLYGMEGRPMTAAAAAASAGGDDDQRHHGPQWALLKFEQPLTAPADAVVIGARLDVESSGDSCRLAFYGRLLAQMGQGGPQELQRLKVFKLKERVGHISRISPDACSAVCKGLFKKESDISFFEGAKVLTGRGEQGIIQGKFGTSGKFKVEFTPPGLQAAAAAAGNEQQQRSAEDNVLHLRYKRFLFDPDPKQKLRQ